MNQDHRQQGSKLVTRESDVIKIRSLSSYKTPTAFVNVIYHGLRAGFGEFRIAFGEFETHSLYPNACVPLAGILDYYKDEGVDFEIVNQPQFVSVAKLLSPLEVSENLDKAKQSPLNVIWRFREFGEVNTLTESFKAEIRRQVECREGVLEGVTWCLNEVMDNVLQHSNAPSGYVMMQIHKTSKHIAICIHDCGQGIFNSLKDSRYNPRTSADAITLAIKEGVTRDSQIGQGNGLWGLHNIVSSNNGILGITSHSSSYRWQNGEGRIYEKQPYISHSVGAATVDFQIDFDEPISIKESLGGYVPIDIYLEDMMNETGYLLYKLSENSAGTGTRMAGERSRNEVLNLLTQSQKVIELDFTGVGILSSSFADEFVGKLVVRFGFYGFNQAFRLRGLNQTNQAILHRSVSQRLAESLSAKEQIE